MFSKHLNVSLNLLSHFYSLSFTLHGLLFIKPFMHHHIALILIIISIPFHFPVFSFLVLDAAMIQFPKCNQYSFISWLQILSAEKINISKEEVGSYAGGSTVSKHFRAQWFNSLLACFSISWQSLKCKKDTHTQNINQLLFRLSLVYDLYRTCTVIFAVVMVITHPVLCSSG